MAHEREEHIHVNGISLCFEQAGEKHDASMVFVHGFGFSKESMLPLYEHFHHRGYHVVSYDTRGSGHSDKPDAWTLEDDVEDLKGLIEGLGLQRPVGVGFSMGSYIVLATAERYPDLFSKIVLIGTRGFDPADYVDLSDPSAGPAEEQKLEPTLTQAKTDQEKKTQINEKLNKDLMTKIEDSTKSPSGLRARVRDTVSLAEKMIEGHEKHPFQATELTERTRPDVKLTPEEFAALQNSYAGFNNLTDANKVSIPVLCLTGDHDHANPPEWGKQVADAVRNGQSFLIPQAGHVAFYENLPEVRKRMERFLKEDE